MVIEENSPETIDFLSQLMSSFFIARGEKQRILPQFDQYYRYLMKTLQIKPRLVPEVAGCFSQFMKAQ